MRNYIIVLILLVVGSGIASRTEPDRPIAMIRKAKPELLVRHANSTEWIVPSAAEPLFSGDSIKTGPEGYAAIQFMDNSLVKVKPNSIMAIMGEVRGKDNTSSRLAVQVGDVFLQVTKRRSDFEVATPSAVAAVKGTKWETIVDIVGNSSFSVIEGRVVVTSKKSGSSTSVKKGQNASVNSNDGAIKQKSLTSSQMGQINSTYDSADQSATPKTIKLRFIDKDGKVREVEVEYFETENN